MYARWLGLVLLVIGCSPMQPQPNPRGRELFEQEFTMATGLGPFFNRRSCANCHMPPGVGPGDETERHAAFVEVPCRPVLGGPVLQDSSLAGPGVPAPAGAVVAIRTSPDLFGNGIMDLVTDTEIVARNDLWRRFTGGRPHVLPNGRLGKFGRKAQVASLREFTADAFEVEQGIEVPEELSEQDSDAVAAFIAAQELRPQGDVKKNILGGLIFAAIGCAGCHAPEWGYTDLVLHDIGTGQADICLLDAKPGEFRTEPLLGLRFATQFLHDGRAQSIEQAVLLHGGGYATRTRLAFQALPQELRKLVLEFLRNL